MKFEAIIFDLDGTLIDSMWVWRHVNDAFFRENNLEIIHDFGDVLEGKSFTETAQFFKEKFSLKMEIADIKKRWNELAYDFYMTKVTLKDDVEKFLEYAKNHDIKMGIATSNSRELAEAVLENLGIAGYFGVIKTSCEVPKGKPSPYIYEAVARELGVMATKCLVIEDVANGVIGAKRAGMTAWAIDDNQEDKNAIKKVATRWVSGYAEALRILEKE